MPVYYTLIVLLTVIIFFSILLILLKWTITIIIKCEERLSCHLNLFSVGQIINMMISFSTEETLISVRLFKRLLCFQKSSLSNHKPSENRKSSTRKRRSGHKTDILIWIKELLLKFTIDDISIQMRGGLDDPYKTGLLSGFLPLLSSLFSQRIEMSFYPTFENEVLSFNGYCRVHFIGAALVRPVFGLL